MDDKRLRLERDRYRANIIVGLYFCFLLFVYYQKIELPLILWLGKILTIPGLLALIGIPIWCLSDGFSKKILNKAIYIKTLLVSLIIMAMLLIANTYFK